MKSRVIADAYGSLWILCTFITVVSARRGSPHTEVLRGRFRPQLLDLYAILAKKAKVRPIFFGSRIVSSGSKQDLYSEPQSVPIVGLTTQPGERKSMFFLAREF